MRQCPHCLCLFHSVSQMNVYVFASYELILRTLKDLHLCPLPVFASRRVNTSATAMAALHTMLACNAHAAVLHGAARKDAAQLKLHIQQQQQQQQQPPLSLLTRSGTCAHAPQLVALDCLLPGMIAAGCRHGQNDEKDRDAGWDAVGAVDDKASSGKGGRQASLGVLRKRGGRKRRRKEGEGGPKQQ